MSLNLSPQQQRGLNVMQQCIYQITFRNSDEFNKWLVKSGLVRCRTLLNCCQPKEKASPCLRSC